MALHLIKLAVGVDDLPHMKKLQAARRKQRRQSPRSPHWVYTRNTPRRAKELLDGGSLYWVIKGVILARQRILDLQEVNLGDGIPRCALVLDAEVIRTEAAPRRPFQGWRYLDPKESPRDLPKGRTQDDPLPPKLAQALAELGLH